MTIFKSDIKYGQQVSPLTALPLQTPNPALQPQPSPPLLAPLPSTSSDIIDQPFPPLFLNGQGGGGALVVWAVTAWSHTVSHTPHYFQYTKQSLITFNTPTVPHGGW